MVDLTPERVNLRVNMSANYPRLSVNLTGLGQNLRVRYVINSYTSKLRAPGRTHTCIMLTGQHTTSRPCTGVACTRLLLAPAVATSPAGTIAAALKATHSRRAATRAMPPF